MIRSEIAERYAKALFRAALDAGVADEVFGDTGNLLAVFSQNPHFRDFLLSPQIAAEDKHELVKKSLEGRASRLLVDLLHFLIDKQRAMFVADIAEAYRHLYEKHKGILEVKAVTAVPLEERLRERLLRTLEEQTKKEIRLTHAVDPSILGGMIVVLEDRIIDGSVRHQLELLRQHLKQTRVTRGAEGPAGAAE